MVCDDDDSQPFGGVGVRVPDRQVAALDSTEKGATPLADYYWTKGHTAELAKYLHQLARKGVDAERLLDLAAARKHLPVDYPTSALAYRVKDLLTPSNRRRPAVSMDPFPRSLQRDVDRGIGL